MSTVDPIDTIAGTRRRAVVAKVLRDRHGATTTLRTYVEDAIAILAALDEDINDVELTAAAGGPAFDEWVILELLGHRRLAGRVREVQLAGAGFLRLDIPATDGHGEQTQYVSPGSVYAMHPTTEAVATAAAGNFRPQPVSRWELERAKAVEAEDDGFTGDHHADYGDEDDLDDQT